MSYTLREHQQEFVDFFNESPYIGAMAWHGMGLGKSLESLHLAKQMIERFAAQDYHRAKFLVLCPKSAHPTWIAECRKFTPEIFSKMIVMPISQVKNAMRIPMYHDIRMVVMDESHYLKNQEAQRTQHFADLLEAIGNSLGKFYQGRILFLSGTPMPNSGYEWYTTWAALATKSIEQSVKLLRSKKEFEKWRSAFSNKETKAWKIGKNKPKHLQQTGVGTSYVGIANEDKMAELIGPIVHFRRVEDCVDLPEKEEIDIDLGLPDDALLKDARIEKPDAYMAVCERLSKAKTPHLINWVKDFVATTNEQLVVFSQYTAPLIALQNSLKSKVVAITGDLTARERAANLKAFQDGRKQVIVMTYGAGAESLNLQNAYVTVYNGYPWTDAKLQQAMARTYRSGQQRTTLHYFLVSGENDKRILHKVLSKAQANATVEDLILENQSKTEIVIDDLI